MAYNHANLSGSDVRFGSKADMCSAQADVRLVPKADIALRNWDIRFTPQADGIRLMLSWATGGAFSATVLKADQPLYVRLP